MSDEYFNPHTAYFKGNLKAGEVCTHCFREGKCSLAVGEFYTCSQFLDKMYPDRFIPGCYNCLSKCDKLKRVEDVSDKSIREICSIKKVQPFLLDKCPILERKDNDNS